jgi:hypothetical protein
MSQFEAADDTVASGTKGGMSAYVPSLQRTEGQPRLSRHTAACPICHSTKMATRGLP